LKSDASALSGWLACPGGAAKIWSAAILRALRVGVKESRGCAQGRRAFSVLGFKLSNGGASHLLELPTAIRAQTVAARFRPSTAKPANSAPITTVKLTQTVTCGRRPIKNHLVRGSIVGKPAGAAS
jgi:hypothetical protein